MSASPGLSIFVVAGEASADVHAAALIRELKAAHPGLHFFGVGSRECAGAGMEIAFDAAGLSVVGVSDWLDKASEVVSVYRRLSRLIRTRRPDAAILLDLPDFNLRMARKLHKQGVPILYYISPQVWAWRTYRVHALRKYVERMLVVFPFEKPFYEKHDVPVEFVGHPLLDAIEPRDHFRSREERLAAPRIALLPGSR
jgi:lipid-A-disaccharide synthase